MSDTVEVVPAGSGEIRHVSVAREADGSFLLTWDVFDSSGVASYVQRFDSAGNALTGADLFAGLAGTAKDMINDISSVGINDSGNAVVVWSQGPNTGSAPNQIFAQAYDSSLKPVGTPVSIASVGSNAIRNVDVAVESDGSFVVVWDEWQYGQLSGGGTQYGFVSQSSFAQHFSAAGTAMGAPITLVTQTGTAFNLINTISSH